MIVFVCISLGAIFFILITTVLIALTLLREFIAGDLKYENSVKTQILSSNQGIPKKIDLLVSETKIE